MLVVLSHGRSLNAYSKDMVYLGRVAEALGYRVHRVNDHDCEDVSERLRRLQSYLEQQPEEALFLGGFSMGAYCSLMAAASQKTRVRGLFLLAPALYIPHYPQHDYPSIANTLIVHGWQDSIVPYQNSLRYAASASASLHLLEAGHMFNQKNDLDVICRLFKQQLEAL